MSVMTQLVGASVVERNMHIRLMQLIVNENADFGLAGKKSNFGKMQLS